MKTVIVKLTRLNNVPYIVTSGRLPINLDNNPDKTIGTCRVFQEEESHDFFGELELDDDVSNDLYFYYVDDNNMHSEFTPVFTGLNLARKIYENKQAKRLGEMIVV